MSRFGTMGHCALALATFVGLAQGQDSGGVTNPAVEAKAKSIRVIEAGSAHDGMARAKITRVLDDEINVDFKELPLGEAVAYLKDTTGIEIQLDTKAMDDASIGDDVPVTRQLHGVTLRSVLRLILGGIDLTYVIKDEVLLITTPDKAAMELVTKIYPVGDLATPRDATLGGEDFKPLIKAIRTTIAPTTWDEVGGPASVVSLAQVRSLIVSQTDEAHEQIADLLAALRKARDAQAAAPQVTALGAVVDTAAGASQRRRQGPSKPQNGPAGPEAPAAVDP